MNPIYSQPQLSDSHCKMMKPKMQNVCNTRTVTRHCFCALKFFQNVRVMHTPSHLQDWWLPVDSILHKGINLLSTIHANFTLKIFVHWIFLFSLLFLTQGCDEFVVFHLGYLDYHSYLAIVSLSNLNFLPKGVTLDDVVFTVRWDLVFFSLPKSWGKFWELNLRFSAFSSVTTAWVSVRLKYGFVLCLSSWHLWCP